MTIERDYYPKDGWKDRILVIWGEDDARPPDAERVENALRRLSNDDYLQVRETIDCGDHLFRLYTNGWVMCTYPEGSDIGIVYKETTP